jgi:hypothetical protein
MIAKGLFIADGPRLSAPSIDPGHLAATELGRSPAPRTVMDRA